jgi:hypothetical protein
VVTTADDGILVLAECGHWLFRSRPDGLTVNPDLPRVCAICPATIRASVAVSPQGMAMVHVTYRPAEGVQGLGYNFRRHGGEDQ